MRTQTKAIGGLLGGLLGATVSASPIGTALADIVVSGLAQVPGLAWVPTDAVRVLVVAGVVYACVYFAPKNQPKEPAV